MREANPQARGTTVTQQPAPAAPPAPPQSPANPDELRALAEKRSEIVNQLEAITDRREELADQLTEAQAGARPGLEARIGVLDERAARLEQEILLADDAIATALASGVRMEHFQLTEAAPPPDFQRVDRDVVFGGFLAFVLAGFALYKWGFARARARFARAGAPADTARMDQLQTAVDAIALEVERISEGQRYVTKVLGEGAAQPVDVDAGEQVLVRRKAT
jgi:hypothetical protein